MCLSSPKRCYFHGIILRQIFSHLLSALEEGCPVTYGHCVSGDEREGKEKNWD